MELTFADVDPRRLRTGDLEWMFWALREDTAWQLVAVFERDCAW